MEKKYLVINKKAYNELAIQYEEREYEIGNEYWEKILDDLNVKNKKVNILELGSGTGRLMKIFFDYNNKFNYTIIDFSKNMIELLKKKQKKCNILNANILDIKLDENKYDVIVAVAFIHCFKILDANKILENIFNALKENGKLIICTTINNIDEEGFYEKEDYKGNIIRFRHKYTKSTFKKILKDNKFKIINEYPVIEKMRNKEWLTYVASK